MSFSILFVVLATGRLFGSGAAPQHEIATVRGGVTTDHAVAASGESLDRRPGTQFSLVWLKLI